MEIVNVEPSDIREVLDHLWMRGKREAVHYGRDKTTLNKWILSNCSEYGYALKMGAVPVAVFGASVENNIYFTWFAATDRFLEIGKKATLLFKRMLKDKKAARPEATLQLLSAVDHPDADRWFRLLGFSESTPEGVFTRYKYNL